MFFSFNFFFKSGESFAQFVFEKKYFYFYFGTNKMTKRASLKMCKMQQLNDNCKLEYIYEP